MPAGVSRQTFPPVEWTSPQFYPQTRAEWGGAPAALSAAAGRWSGVAGACRGADAPTRNRVDQIISPFILYGACVVGAIGVGLALPRAKGPSPQALGGVLAAVAGGLVLLGLLWAGKQPANVYFYIFSIVALGSALRVITHPKPVYAALYFILTIISTAGLFLILSAEFMSFALIIVYAGAILITYLFVIMLATQAPTEDQEQALSPYDIAAREPLFATAAGFIVLGVLTTMVFSGVRDLPGPAVGAGNADRLLADMPRKVDAALRETGTLEPGEKLVVDSRGRAYGPDGEPAVDPAARTALVTDGSQTRAVPLPEDLRVTNTEQVGFNLLRDHPGTIEIAGVILLMAMLGSVVLSRRQVQIDEDAKARQVRNLAAEVAASKEAV